MNLLTPAAQAAVFLGFSARAAWLSALVLSVSLGAAAQTSPVPTVVLQPRTVGAAFELDGTVQAVNHLQ